MREGRGQREEENTEKRWRGIVGKHHKMIKMMPTSQGDTSTHLCTYVFEGLPKLCELVEALFDDA